jgi:hypothetical protein
MRSQWVVEQTMTRRLIGIRRSVGAWRRGSGRRSRRPALRSESYVACSSDERERSPAERSSASRWGSPWRRRHCAWPLERAVSIACCVWRASASAWCLGRRTLDKGTIAQPYGPSTLYDLLTDLLTNGSRRAGMRRDAMASELGIAPGQDVFRGTGWDTVVGAQVGLGPGPARACRFKSCLVHQTWPAEIRFPAHCDGP